MSVRRVSNRGGKNIIGKFPSLKMKRAIAFESTIERDYLYVLDYEAEVTHFEGQPLVIRYEHAGKPLRYTPDFHIVQAGRDVLVECKPASRVADEDNQRKFSAGRRFAAERGWEFQVVTDEALRAGARLANIKLLRRYACHQAIRPEIKGGLYALLRAMPEMSTISQIQAAAKFPPAIVLAALLHMAYHHEVVIPLDESLISDTSPVCVPGGTR